MTNIKFFGLGGFGEIGKNMYVLLINGKYFIFDTGVKYPSNELYGVDEIIPDFNVIKRVKNNVVGVFLSNAHEEHIGALSYILKELELDIYGSNLVIEMIKDNLDEANIKYPTDRLKLVDKDSVLDFNGTKVTFFKTTNSIPESLGIVVKTEEGNIVYTSEYSFDQSDNKLYQTDFGQINELSKEKTLALLVESLGTVRDVQIGFERLFNHEMDNIFEDSENRIIFAIYSSDLSKIQKIINLSIQNNRKIAILGRKAQRLVDIAISNKYLSIPKESFKKLLFIDGKNQNDDKDLVVLVTGQRHEPFYMLQRMAKKTDKLIHLQQSDTVVLLVPPFPGTEKIQSRTLDLLYRSDVTVHDIKADLLTTSHATSAEVKMMINLLQPQYIIPVMGEYQHQCLVQKIALELGYPEKNTLLLENGDLLDYQTGEFKHIKGDIPTGDILIDGTPIYDKNDAIMTDREQLAADGVVILSCNIGKNDYQIKGDILVEAKGFYNPPEHDAYMLQIKKFFQKEVSDIHIKPRRLWGELKRKVRGDVSSYITKTSQRNPILITIINEI